ncbi:MAG TPA: hypothetical protein VFB08_11615 [Burkholderiales bacterium]|nr:hypothetical protein [Burkholderiales bacterium]
MACLLRFGAPPRAANPDSPTEKETRALREMLEKYQHIFDTH